MRPRLHDEVVLQVLTPSVINEVDALVNTAEVEFAVGAYVGAPVRRIAARR